MFGVGGYVLGEGIRRIAGPFGWTVLIGAIVFVFLLWRYYKKNEDRFLDKAEAAAANDAKVADVRMAEMRPRFVMLHVTAEGSNAGRRHRARLCDHPELGKMYSNGIDDRRLLLINR